MLGKRYRFRLWSAFTLLTLIAASLAARGASNSNPTVEQLKSKVASTDVRDRPHLCVEIAQKQLAEADKFYAASEFEKGEAALTDVVAYAELARDYAVQTHRYQKQAEIATRNMTRKLNDLLHSLGGPDQAPVRDTINRLQRVRDDLLAAMFPKGAK